MKKHRNRPVPVLGKVVATCRECKKEMVVSGYRLYAKPPLRCAYCGGMLDPPKKNCETAREEKRKMKRSDNSIDLIISKMSWVDWLLFSLSLFFIVLFGGSFLEIICK